MPHLPSGQASNRSSQPRIDWLTFQREHAEDALMDAAQGFLADESFQPLDAQGELSDASDRLADSPLERNRSRFSGAVYSGP